MICKGMKRVVITLTGLLIFNILCVGLNAVVAQDNIAYESGGNRDPFVPLISGNKAGVQGLFGVESADDLNLEGVIFDPDQGSLIIVNGVVLKEGESQENVKVLKVEKNGVSFEINELEVFKPFEVQ
jgi:hypothetical protein